MGINQGSTALFAKVLPTCVCTGNHGVCVGDGSKLAPSCECISSSVFKCLSTSGRVRNFRILCFANSLSNGLLKTAIITVCVIVGVGAIITVAILAVKKLYKPKIKINPANDYSLLRT